MSRPDHGFLHRWHVAINDYTRDADGPWDKLRFMYEAKTMADEVPRLTYLFGLERRGELPKMHRQCSHQEPEPIEDEHLTCCLGVECRECPMLKAVEGADLSGEEQDAAKAWTCVAHIVSEGGDPAGEGYVLTESDRIYWECVHASLASPAP